MKLKNQDFNIQKTSSVTFPKVKQCMIYHPLVGSFQVVSQPDRSGQLRLAFSEDRLPCRGCRLYRKDGGSVHG